ncbi:MAG: pyridoxal phosphate-dependent aminotransferase [Chitinophagia bacterium]
MSQLASRLDGIGEYYFSSKLREIAQLNEAGHKVINLGIGSPDLPPHPSVVEALYQEASKPNTHAYQPYKGSPVFLQAVANWYKKWYGVEVNPSSEVLPLIGSKEGIVHICMTYLDKGDAALVPNPGYPTYAAAVKLSGASVIDFALSAEHDFHPDVNSLKALVDEHNNKKQGRVKLLFLNYPHMPTGQLPKPEVLKALINFAKAEDIIIVHDNPYSFVLNDHPASLLSMDPDKEVVIELNSLSKSHNMAGWRVGMVVASSARIAEIIRFKSNMDSGMFLPVQMAAAKALMLGKEWYEELNAVYAERKKLALQLLDLLGCSYSSDQVGMFVWAKVPSTYASGFALSDDMLNKAKVFLTPGGIFGSAGDGYIRISLCSKKEVFEEAIGRIEFRQ